MCPAGSFPGTTSSTAPAVNTTNWDLHQSSEQPQQREAILSPGAGDDRATAICRSRPPTSRSTDKHVSFGGWISVAGVIRSRPVRSADRSAHDARHVAGILAECQIRFHGRRAARSTSWKTAAASRLLVSSAFHWQKNPGPCCGQHQHVCRRIYSASEAEAIRSISTPASTRTPWNGTQRSFASMSTVIFTTP